MLCFSAFRGLVMLVLQLSKSFAFEQTSLPVYLLQILTVQLLRAAIITGTPDVKEEPMLLFPIGTVMSFRKKSKKHYSTFKTRLEGWPPFSLHILWYLFVYMRQVSVSQAVLELVLYSRLVLDS